MEVKAILFAFILHLLAISNLLQEDDEDDIFCNMDDDGYIFDENGDYVLDKHGKRVKLTPAEIDKFNNNNMIE